MASLSGRYLGRIVTKFSKKNRNKIRSGQKMDENNKNGQNRKQEMFGVYHFSLFTLGASLNGSTDFENKKKTGQEPANANTNENENANEKKKYRK